uniref:Bifunctional inhibitor/plant lipid transfer protein/seed storage helical domain-containing protein n=1 Tax=Chenopodium quinoa TaxID=63459 RepID=A0A803MFW0_CHEQI
MVVIGPMQGAHGQVVCGIEVTTLLPCLPSVKQPNPPAPGPDCCNPLKLADLKCLCAFADNPQLPIFGIDKGLFLALPGKCGLPNCPA